MFKLIADKNLVVEDGRCAKYVPRTLKERIFGKLYNKIYAPFQKKRLFVYTTYKPDEAIYKTGNMLVAHPVMLIKIKAALGENYGRS